MTNIQKYIMLGCILTNLVGGNLWLYITGTKVRNGAPGEPHYSLMISTSIACIVCYLFLFIKIHPETRNVMLLWLLSLAACVVIAMLGNTVASLLFLDVNSVGDFLTGVLTGLVTGFIGAILYFQFVIPMSLGNLFWLMLFVRN